MTKLDNLTIEEIETLCKESDTPMFCVVREDNSVVQGSWLPIAKQLLDIMRENDENCRFLGMSEERETALLAENERLRKALKEIAGGYDELH